jgi:tetratricopeptide (TPR) repeat protein
VIALREPLQRDISKFESAEIQRARQLAGAGRWHEAFEVLDAAKAQWRNSDTLDQAYQALEKRETLLFNRLRTELLVDEARWLHARLGTLEQLETLHRRDASEISDALQRRRVELVSTLTELGNAFAAEEDWLRTRDLLGAAQQLSGSDEVPAALVTARKQLSLEANRSRRAREEQVQNKAVTLLEAYEDSRSLSDLLAARDFISGNNQSGQLDQYASRLEAICQQRYQLGLQEGDALYAQGRYEDAFQAWENVARIYPGDAELEKKMERARKVLSNLKALSDS